MIRYSKNGNMYFFNLANRSVTIRNKEGNVKMIFVGEAIHESGAIFTEKDFNHMLNSLEA